MARRISAGVHFWNTFSSMLSPATQMPLPGLIHTHITARINKPAYESPVYGDNVVNGLDDERAVDPFPKARKVLTRFACSSQSFLNLFYTFSIGTS